MSAQNHLSEVPLAGWQAPGGWSAALAAHWASPEGRRLLLFLRSRIDAGALVYPRQPLHMLSLTPLESVRVVILGQDPYHGPGQAEGLAFSVSPGQTVPPSLRNVHAELSRDMGLSVPTHGSLQAWARRGALLLNTCLTVEDGQPGSHSGRGWEVLTGALLEAVTLQPAPCAYLLWGRSAQRWADDIASNTRRSGQPALILQANHPSPLSARRGPIPFIGCGHFSQTAHWLARLGVPWDWSLAASESGVVTAS